MRKTGDTKDLYHRALREGTPTPSSRNTGLHWWAAWPLIGERFLEEVMPELGLDGERYLRNLRKAKPTDFGIL